ncbi:DUF1120 domain-containing protein [Pseudomonas sp. BJa5]|uniref:DUF1120 domain-containing protein n=1 Tax=Pseudomonas sp. BJa5 TaxID=2936270 RepID=UPI00255A30FA|nr:DUF1120 domain-containing protein [Pseudomonas sp. BGr12]MDL2423964.1 DUF1120 domain-containing protein [Pseudomonas sp. BGr12]
MKTLHISLLALLASPLTAMAADCQLQLGPAPIDYGIVDRSRLEPGSPGLPLARKTAQLTLNCASSEDLSLFFAASALDNQRFELAASGHYRLQASQALVDGERVELARLDHPGATPGPAMATLDWQPHAGIVPLKAGKPVQGRSLSLTLAVEGELAAKAFEVREAKQQRATGEFHAPQLASTAELALHWQIQPAACTPTLSQGGIVDYGRITSQSLNSDRRTRLPTRQLSLSIQCDSPARYALRMHDNRDGSSLVNSLIFYGLGYDASDNRIGLYEVQFDPQHITADQLPRVFLTQSTAGGIGWSDSGSAPRSIADTTVLGFSDEAMTTKGPVAIRNLNATLDIMPVIAPTNELDNRQDIPLDGSGTLEIIYL